MQMNFAEVRSRVAENQKFFWNYDLETIAGLIGSVKERKYHANVLGGG